MKIAKHNGNLWNVMSPMSGFPVTVENFGEVGKCVKHYFCSVA